MRVAVIHNRDTSAVINVFGMQNRETYNPRTVERVAAALEKGGHNVKVIDGNMHVVDELGSFMPRVLSGERPGMVFNMAYGIQGQSRYTHVPAFLEMLGVPYVGSSPSGHAMALDKVMSKVLFQHAGLPTPAFWVFNGAADIDRIDPGQMPWPLIVKPKMEAVSFGLRVVYDVPSLAEAVAEIAGEFQQQALVEQFVAGREYAVGLLGNAPPETLPIVEIDFGGDPNGIQTLHDKKREPRGKLCPADLPVEKAEELRRLAIGAFEALGLYDFGRVDIRMDQDGRPYLLEINSMASLGETGSYVHSAKTAGYNFDSLVNRMLDVAARRYFGADVSTVDAAIDESTANSAPAGKAKQPLNVRLRNYVRTNLSATLANLRTFVEVNSEAHTIDGVNRLGRILVDRLTPLGFHVQVYPQLDVGDVYLLANHAEEQHDVLLLAHLDTSTGLADYVPYREERGRIFGSGVAETKGGLAVMLAALQALRHTRSLRKVRIGVLLVSDATLGSKVARRPIAELGAKARHIVGMTAEPDGALITSMSGRIVYRIELHNKKLGLRADEPRPADVIGAVATKVAQWHKLSQSEEWVRVLTHSVEARRHRGVVPDQARVELEVQYWRPEDGAILDEKVRRVAEKGPAGLEVQVRKGVLRPPRQASDGTKAFAARVLAAASKLGVPLVEKHREQPSEVGFAPEAVPALDGFGPVGEASGSPGESVQRDSLVDRGALLAMTIRECAAE